MNRINRMDLLSLPKPILEIMYDQSFNLLKLFRNEVSESGGQMGSKEYIVKAIKIYEPQNVSKIENSEFVFSHYNIFFQGRCLMMLLESKYYKSKIFKDLFIILDKISEPKVKKAINYFLAESKIKIVKNEKCILSDYYFTDFSGNRLSKDKVQELLSYW